MTKKEVLFNFSSMISILTATRAVTRFEIAKNSALPISILTATRAVTAKLPKFLFLKSTSFAQFVHSRIAHTQNFTIYPSNLFFTSHFRSYLQCESNRYVMLTYGSHNCISVSLLLSSKQWYIVLHMLKLFLDTIKTFYYISFFGQMITKNTPVTHRLVKIFPLRAYAISSITTSFSTEIRIQA